jgi:proteasome lid subunit RPN8/RPN11
MTEYAGPRTVATNASAPPPVASDGRISVPEPALDVMRTDARRGYPEEVCGILIGRVDGSERTIERVIPVENARQDERARRYVIDADVLRRVEAEATDNGLDVIGFYHSHPDHPAVPSTFDREHSWPWYTYIILSVRSGDVVDTRAWQLSDDRSRFRQITVVHPETSPRNQPQKRGCNP